MYRPLSLLLLLALPSAVSGQDSAKELSPALRAKLLAQNTAVPPTDPAQPNPAVPAAAQPEPGTAQPATGAAPAGQPPTVTPGSATTPPPAVTPPPAPTPRVPRPSIPLPGGNRPGPGTRPTPNTRTGAGGGTGAGGDIAAAPASTGEGLAPDPNNPWGDIAFVDAPIVDVIDKYQEISQRHVLREPNMTGTVTVVANPNPLRPFTREEAAEFMKAALALQGFTIQRYNETTDKILMLNKPPGIEGPLQGSALYTREDDLPETDDIVNFVLTLKHLPVVEASAVIAQAVPTHTWTKYVAVPSANSIFVQETVSNIRTLLSVVKSLDLPPAKMVHVWVELERASAEDVQAILDQILQAQTQGRGTGATSGFRSISPAAAAANLAQPNAPQVMTAGAAGAASGLMPDGSSVIVKADPRTNRVFINGPEEHVTFLRKLIHEFDEPSRVKSLLTQQLRYIPVNEFFNLALTSLEATGAGQAGTGSAGGGQAPGGARQTGGRNQDFGGGGGGGQDFRSNFSSRNTGASTNQFGNTGGRTNTGRTGGGGLGGGGLSGSGGILEAPQAQTVGKTLLISDPRTNSLIVSGPPDSIQRVSDLVKEMDRRPYQVHINAVIAQMAIGDDMLTSVDILRKATTVNIFGETVDASGFFRTAPNGAFIDPTALNTLATVPEGSGLNFYAAAAELFNAYVHIIDTSSKSKLLAKPHITVANNEIGTISNGTRVPIPANQQSSVVGGVTQSLNSSVEYENVVLSLNVQPLINSKNEITLTIDQLNDSIEGTTLISGNAIPNISTQELSTKITVPNGAIIVLGGLISDGESRGNTGLPILSKIPIVKYLFGSNTKRKQRRELLVLLQARIIETADDIVDVNVSEIQRTVVGPDAELFTKPDRNTDNVKLPTFESDVPFNDAGIIQTTTEETTIIPAAPTGKSTKSRSRRN